MIRVESQNIDFEQDRRVYEAYLLYDTIEESEAIYEEFQEFLLEEYDRGEITLAIESWRAGTKKEFMKEIRSRVRDLNR
tara:strand:+ start:132 stop:368 length:237 start_codon:yes stop_codon:yes gene_type:complete